MGTLRTPKNLTGIDLGMPSLTFRAWWEAQYGAEGWATLGKIPRRAWMDYLRWYRAVLRLPVRNDAQGDADRAGPARPVRLLAGGEALLARKVVLATGIQGGGEWHVPDFVERLPCPSLRPHLAAIDYAAMAGRIAILGGGASAFDNAATALEAGVAEVHVFVRRTELPRVNPIRFMERGGITPRYPALDEPPNTRHGLFPAP